MPSNNIIARLLFYDLRLYLGKLYHTMQSCGSGGADVLKGFIANQVGQSFNTNIDRKVMDAFDELGINYYTNYKEDKLEIYTPEENE